MGTSIAKVKIVQLLLGLYLNLSPYLLAALIRFTSSQIAVFDTQMAALKGTYMLVMMPLPFIKVEDVVVYSIVAILLEYGMVSFSMN